SSDVCSSDLKRHAGNEGDHDRERGEGKRDDARNGEQAQRTDVWWSLIERHSRSLPGVHRRSRCASRYLPTPIACGDNGPDTANIRPITLMDVDNRPNTPPHHGRW